MLTLYIVAAILGGGLILLSALGGFGDHSFDADANTDIDTSHDLTDVAHASSDFWLPFFSMRFWVYFVGGFGLFGLATTLFNVTAEPIRMFASLATGLLTGTIAAYLMRWARRDDTDSSVKEADFLGVTGTMVVPPTNGEPGKIRVSVKGDLIDMLALPLEGASIAKGDEIVVVTVEGDRAVVAKASDYLNS